MLNHGKKTLLPTLAIAACMAAPAAFAQNHGMGKAQVQAVGQALGGADVARSLSDGPRNPNAATPATPATPAVPGQSPAIPATPATPAKKDWTALDADGNGTLSATEAASQQKLSRAFAQADANANGELTQDEYDAWLAANKGNGNGKGRG